MMITPISNNNLELLAYKLRQCTVLPEYRLWQQLCKSDDGSTPFLRQVALAGFIVDIFCPAKKLVIDVGGDSHDFKYGEEDKRAQTIQALGLKLITITSQEIRENMEKAIQQLKIH